MELVLGEGVAEALLRLLRVPRPLGPSEGEAEEEAETVGVSVSTLGVEVEEELRVGPPRATPPAPMEGVRVGERVAVRVPPRAATAAAPPPSRSR